MSELRKRIELGFESFGSLVYRRRWIAVGLMLALSVLSASGLPQLTFDTSTEGFLHKDDPVLIQYNAFRHEFGRDEMILAAIRTDDVFSLEFLNRLKAFHEAVEDRVPHVDEITSLINARDTRGQGDRLIVGDLLEDWPETEAELEAVRERVLSNPLYINRIISEDARFTTVAIRTDTYSDLGDGGAEDPLAGFEDAGTAGNDTDDLLAGFEADDEAAAGQGPVFLTDRENSAAVDAARKLTREFNGPGFETYLAGSPVLTDKVKRSMMADMKRFVGLVLLVIGLCLLVMFRRISGVVLPLFVVALALTSTVGLMGRLGTPIKVPTAVLPSFLLAVGVGAAVHLLAMFYQRVDRGDGREASIRYALGHSGLAIVMTGLTTAAGLGSFATAQVAPVADLGRFAAIGVLWSLALTLVLLPALLALWPIKPRNAAGPAGARMNRVLTAFARFSVRRAKSVTAVTFILLAVSLAGAVQLVFYHNVLTWLPENDPLRESFQVIDREMRGSVTVEILFDTGRENGLYDVETLNRLDDLTRRLEEKQWGDVFVGKATALTDMLKEIHQALNENREAFYRIPQDPELIPQEFLLFENSGSDDLEDVVDSRFQTARLTVKMPWEEAVKYMPALAGIEQMAQGALGGRAEVTVTGLMPILVRTVVAAIHSAARSYVLAGAVITVMMILLIGSVRLGLISMIPNLTPIVLALGAMHWFGVPFDLFTMLIGSIAIGLAVDDTVHFMHNFRRYMYETGDVSQSVELTLTTAGRAMLVTSVVLSLGFFIYMFASMNNLFHFGLLTGLTIILALLADFLTAPALMALYYRQTTLKREE